MHKKFEPYQRTESYLKRIKHHDHFFIPSLEGQIHGPLTKSMKSHIRKSKITGRSIYLNQKNEKDWQCEPKKKKKKELIILVNAVKASEPALGGESKSQINKFGDALNKNIPGSLGHEFETSNRKTKNQWTLEVICKATHVWPT